MAAWGVAVVATAAVPLAAAWRANRGTTLRHALVWAAWAWGAWLAHAAVPGPVSGYAALTLTSGAGVAVLGARRPGVAAWDFVVLSLLAILWVGWAEGAVTGTGVKLGPVRLMFLVGLLSVAVMNYLPTRLGAGTLSLGLAGAGVFADLRSETPVWAPTAAILAGLAPWLAWAGLWRLRDGRPADDAWRRFRDRFGAVWAARLAEQFNRAAANAGWPVRLRWTGLVPREGPVPAEWSAALAALQKRFSNE